ncbi:MAG: PhzF family phenazine biosynthesis protein [Thermoplasmatota archaeon]
MKIYQVDAFTDTPFSGNPAGVCILNRAKEEKWMQNVAMEMNLSETAFLHKAGDYYNLRWFTPEDEVDLCGHATLASSHILWEKGLVKKDKEIRFSTNSGILTAQRNKGWIEMDFPLEKVEKATPPDKLTKALDIKPVYTGKSRFDYLIEVESENTVREVEPNFNLLKKVKTRGVMITSASYNKEYDFVSRFFAPRVGVNEDPVTGSSHCSLGYYWKNRLNKNKFKASQLSKRGGEIRVEVVEDKRVILGGQAVTVIEGEIHF